MCVVRAGRRAALHQRLENPPHPSLLPRWGRGSQKFFYSGRFCRIESCWSARRTVSTNFFRRAENFCRQWRVLANRKFSRRPSRLRRAAWQWRQWCRQAWLQVTSYKLKVASRSQDEVQLSTCNSHVTTIARLIFHLAAFEKQPRLLVTFFVEIMQQRRVGVARKPAGQFVQAREQRQQARFGIRRRHGLDGFSQLRERREQFIFNGVFQMRWKSLLSDKVSEFARQPRMIEINIAEQIYARDEPRHAGGQHHHKHGRQI